MRDAWKGLTVGHGATSGNPTRDLIGGLIQKSGGIGGFNLSELSGLAGKPGL